MKKVSITDLATSLKLSPAAVSMALNGRSSVSESTRVIVRDAAEKMGYRRPDLEHRRGPRPGCSMPRKQRTFRNLVFAMNTEVNMSMPVYMDLMQGIQDAATELNCNLSLVRFSGNRIITRSDVHGCIVIADTNEVVKCNVPLIRTMGSGSFDRVSGRVSYNNRVIGTIAAEYLLSRGRRNLAVFSFSGKNQPLFRERQEQFVAAARNGGAKAEIYETDSYSVLEKQFDSLMTGNWNHDGVFSAADMITLKLYMLFSRHNLRPVQDFDIVSCNNELQLVNTLSPTPAEIDIHARQVGYRAVENLLHKLRKPDTPNEQVFLTPELITPDEKKEIL